MNFLEAWRRRLAQLSDEHFYLYLLAATAFVVAVGSTAVALSLNRNFLTIACDTAAVQSALVNTLDGRWFRDTAYDGPNLLGLHTSFIVLPLSLVYALLPSANTLFTLQIFGLWSAVIPLYLIAAVRLGKPPTALIVAAAGMVSPLLLEMAWAPFHTETWILPGVLWSYYFYLRNRPLAFWVSTLFALCCGEQAALIYITLGATWLLFDDGRRWRLRYGINAVTAGVVWLALAVGVVIPLMHHPEQQNLVAYNYTNFDAKSFPELAEQVAQNPLQTALFLFSLPLLFHFVGLIGVPLLLAIASRRYLLLLAPALVYFLMSDRELYLYFHAYYFQFAFLPAYVALTEFLRRHALGSRRAALVLVATFAVNVMALTQAAGFYFGLGLVGNDPFTADLHHIFATIPTDAGVYSPHRYSAYLSNRVNMVMGDLLEPDLDFDAMLRARFPTTDVEPDQIDYIVCDFVNDQCGRRQAGYSEDRFKERKANIDRLVKTGKWQVFWSKSNVVILRRVPK